MPLRILFLIPLMVAFAAVVSQYIGWRYPLATTSGDLEPTAALGIVAIAELGWTVTNVYTVVLLRRTWRSLPGALRTACGFAVTFSVGAQVLLGRLAVRDLQQFMEDVPGKW